MVLLSRQQTVPECQVKKEHILQTLAAIRTSIVQHLTSKIPNSAIIDKINIIYSLLVYNLSSKVFIPALKSTNILIQRVSVVFAGTKLDHISI